MNFYSQPIEKIFSGFKTSKEGPLKKEVKKRVEEFGENVLQSEEKKSYLAAYIKQYTQFFAVLLEIAALLSLVADYYVPGEGSDILSYAIICAVVINATFSFWQEYKADKAMEALLKLMPTIVKVKREGKVIEVDSKEIVVGDILMLEEGDKIAADGVLFESSSLYINISSLNGESKPSKRENEPKNAKTPLEAKNMVFAGTTVISGSGTAVVIATGQATEFGKIASLTKNVEKTVTPIQKEIMRITHILTIIAILMGIVFFALGLMSEKGFLMASIFALSLIVANVPEGMLPTITLALSMASQRMARRNALIKNLDSVQTLGSATVICTDKTGTLTKNEMTAKALYLSSGEHIEITGSGYFESGTFIYKEGQDDFQKVKKFLTFAAVNTHALIEEDKTVGDPTELAIVAASKKAQIEVKNIEKIEEFPFTSERKMMSTFAKIGGEEVLCSKGAPEIILDLCSSYLNETGKVEAIKEEARKKFADEALAFEKRAFRVLAVAFKNGNREERDLTFAGFVAIMDLPRPEVKEALAKCKSAGIRTMMITGDNPHTAEAVARDIELDYDKVYTGDMVEEISEEKLAEELKEQNIIFSRMSSNQKLKIAMALQNNGEVVAMTGDGVNDAPALKKADIGVAMGRSGTEVAKEAADMILLDDNFSSIVAAIEEGRTVYYNIKKFVTYILASNVPEIIPYILQFFFKIPLPLSVIQILSIDLGTDMFPGVALGSEKPEKNIMKQAPVGKYDKIMDWEVFKRGYFFLGLIEATASMVAFISFLLLHGWEYGQVDLADPYLHRQAMTMTLLGAVSCQMLNVWTIRSWEFPAWSVGFLSNKLLLIAMVVEGTWIWMLLNWEPAQKVFNTAHVPLSELWILLPFPILLFVSHELYKYRRRVKVAKIKSEK